MNRKWVGGSDLSWRLSLGCDHSDTLPAGLGFVGVGDLNKP